MTGASGSGAGLHGQAKVIHVVRQLVDGWRGFPLGSASDPYPAEPARYEPTREGERPVSETSRRLLGHWFRQEPHLLGGKGRPVFPFKYWPHQRRFVETVIYLHEVRGIRRTEELWALAGLEPLGPQRDPWAKLGGQLATGSGKTKMMSLVIAWSYLNAVLEGEDHLGLGRHALLIAPGLFVRDRLFQDFFPPRNQTSVFFADPVVPSELLPVWGLKVYSPVTCPRRLDPDEGALVVTNYHQLLRERDPDEVREAGVSRQIDLLFSGKEPARLEAVQAPLIERFGKSRGLLVLNDEAHHVWDEAGHQKYEAKAEREEVEGAKSQMAWIRSLRTLNGDRDAPGRLGLQVDLSATLYEEAGSAPKQERKGRRATEFKAADLFRHTVVHYGLAEAIGDGIVKKPILERVEVRNKQTGQIEPLVREGQPNAWETYRNLLATGIERWQKVKAQLEAEGDARKPILFVLCSDRHEAKEVANYLSFGEAAREDLTHRTPTGYSDPETGERLFIEKQTDGSVRSTVVEIHIGEKEERNEEDWDRVRQAVNAIDLGAFPDPEARDADGQPVLHPNPYNVVVSVMMLKEGWDVRNVKVIVPLRPCDSRTLTEQTLGRGLRKMHPPVIDDEGRATFRTEQLFVIEHPSFKAILDQVRDIIEARSKDEIEHARDYVPVLRQDREGVPDEEQVRLVRFEGMVEVEPDWRAGFDLERVPALAPRQSWVETVPETEIRTFLKAALAESEDVGQQFTIPETPGYRDFDQVIERAYAIPLLRDLRSGFHHKNAVKGVVREFLERRTFALPAGVPLSFDRAIEGGHGLIALCNLARSEVIHAVTGALLPALREAFSAERRTSEAQLSELDVSRLPSYQAINQNLLEHPTRTPFDRAAFGSKDELELAVLLERARGVTSWLYNHRSSVGYSIPYDWKGYPAQYFPDFFVRAKLGEVFHNFIIEVKGRLDDRDREKARCGQRHCELLSAHDREPWHYLFLLENEPLGREDITWWKRQSVVDMGDLLRRQEAMPLLPDASPTPAAGLTILDGVPDEDRFREALPVHDLAAAAGGFSAGQTPEVIGWARVHLSRRLDRRMFVARVQGKSMEPRVPTGAWCVFRAFPAGETPSSVALDGRRVVVELRDATDPETGGRYTLKRWRVTKLGAGGGVEEVELQPDNPAFRPMRFVGGQAEIRVVAELLEVVG